MAKNQIAKNASIVMIFSLLAKLSSFLVELLVASGMGATKETDAFYMVYGIVQIIYPMISVGIWKVFLPEYKTRIVLDRMEEANEMTHKLLTVFSIISGIIILLVFCAPKPVIFVFAPGFDESSSLISQNLLRIVIFILIFNTSATFASAILQSHGEFSKAQFKEVLVHVPPLLYLLIFRGKADIKGLAYSIVAGAAAASITSTIFARKHYRYRLPGKLIDSNVLAILKQVPVTCLNSIINQLNNIIDKMFASTLATGAVTYLNYGSKLIHLFDGIFSTAISTALFPYLTELVARKDEEKLKSFLKNYIVLISLILLPVTAIIVMYPVEIVKIVFGHGKFDDASVAQTALVLLMYGIGLLLMCLTTIINDIFYILKRTNILLWTTVLMIVSNIILDFAFVRIWEVAGLALATTVSLMVTLIIKFIYIKDVFRFDLDLARHLVMIVLYCSVSCVLPLWLANRFVLPALPKLLSGGLAFASVYLILVLAADKGMRKILLSSLSVFSKKGRK